MMKSIFAFLACAAVVVSGQGLAKSGAMLGATQLPAPILAQPMAAAVVAQPMAAAAVATTVSAAKSQPLAFTSVKAAQMNAAQTLPVIELSPIIQQYSVPSSYVTQENIKQPITQPVLQPYLQRYVQQAQPIVQPIVNRVVQPVIHRELHPYLQSTTEQGPAAFTLTQPTQYTMQYNQAIVGADLPQRPLASIGAAKSTPAAATFLSSSPASFISSPASASFISSAPAASLAFTSMSAAQKSHGLA